MNNMGRKYFYTEECEEILKTFWTDDMDYPHLLIGQPPNGGVGSMQYVEMLARAMHQRKKMLRPFKRTFLALQYPHAGSQNEMNKFFESPRIIAEFSNEFKGVFCIDLSEWVYSLNKSDFMTLMEYVHIHRQHTFFVFIVNSTDAAVLESILSTISRFVNLHCLTMDYLDSNSYSQYAMKILSKNKFFSNAEVHQAVNRSIEKIKQHENFEGYKSIEHWAANALFAIGKNSLERTRPCDYIKSATENFLQLNPIKSPKRRIGF